MTDYLPTVSFTAAGVNLLGLAGPSAFTKTITLVSIPRIENTVTITEADLGLGAVPTLDAGITFFYHAEAALTATLSYDAGSVDIDYNIDVPDIASTATSGGLPYFLNTNATWSTAGFAYHAANSGFTTHAPILANNFLSLDFSYDVNAGITNAHVHIAGVGLDQSDFFPDPLQFPPEYQHQTMNLLRIDQLGVSLFGTTVSEGGAFTFNQSGLVGFVGLPDVIPDTPGVDPHNNSLPIGWSDTTLSGNAQLPTLSATGDSANFANLDFHLFDFLADVVPILAPLKALKGSIDDGDYLNWTVVDLYPHIGAQLTQDIHFVATGVSVHIVTSAGQVMDGALGDDFAIETPSGAGSLAVTPTYTLHGYFENETGIKLNWGVHLTALQLGYGYDTFLDSDSGTFSFGPNKDIIGPYSSAPIDVYKSEKLDVDFAPELGVAFSLVYENFATGSDSPDTDFLTPNQLDYPSPNPPSTTPADIIAALNSSNFGNDTIIGNTLANRINGGFDDDSIFGAGGSDTMTGGGGNDYIDGDSGNDEIYGGFGNDQIHGGEGDDYLSTGDLKFGDTASTNAGGADSLDGGEGSDTLVSKETDGADVLDGGIDSDGTPDIDKLFIFRTGLTTAMSVDMNDVSTFAGVTLQGGTVIRRIEQFAFFKAGFGDDTVKGGAYGDQIVAGAGDDRVEGRGGNDALEGGTGDDALYGGTEDDDLFGDAGADLLDGGTGADLVDGGAGNDLILETPDGGADSLFGGTGIDVLVYTSTATGPIHIDLTGSGNQVLDDGTGTLISGFERLQINVAASTQGASIVGGTSDDFMVLGSGDDTVASRGGDDIVYAMGGNDRVVVGTQALDRATGAGTGLDGGQGSDTLAVITPALETRPWDISFVAGAGTHSLQGSISYTNFEHLEFTGSLITAAADHVVGGSGGDSIDGGAGADTLDGGSGRDVVFGGAGNDLVYVRANQAGDTLYGDLLNQPAVGTDRIDIDMSQLTSGLNFTFSPTGINQITSAPTLTTEFSGFELLTLTTGSGNDTLVGGNGQGTPNIRGPFGYGDRLVSGDGNDVIDGRGGEDDIDTGAGDDTIYWSQGRDRIDGGAGDDTYVVRFSGATSGLGLPPAAISFRPARATDDYVTLSDGTTIANVEHLKVVSLPGAVYPASPIVIHGGDNSDDIEVLGSGGPPGSPAANSLYGEGGDDYILSGAGSDSLIGGDDNDTLAGGAGSDTLDGGLGDDVLRGGTGVNVFSGGEGTDEVDYSTVIGAITLNLGIAAAQVTGSQRTEKFAGIENARGGFGSDSITGSTADNLLIGNGGADTLRGAGSDDTLVGGTGDDFLDGGTGSDTATYAATLSAVSVDLSLTAAQSTGGAGLDTLLNIENLVGSAFADTLAGNTAANVIDGGDGSDRIRGGAGRDTLIGGAGDRDVVSYAGSHLGVHVDLNVQDGTTAQLAVFREVDNGDAAGDVLSGFEKLIGSALADELIGTIGTTIIGGAGADTLDGTSGGVFSYETSGAAVSVNLLTGVGSGGDAQGDSLTRVVNLLGSGFADKLTGDNGSDSIAGGKGNDTIEGGGNDYDTLEGGDGRDTISYKSETASVIVDLSLGKAGTTVTYASIFDQLAGFENITGGSGDDSLQGSSGANSIDGGDGNDTIEGGDGGDTLNGGNAPFGDVLSYEHAAAGVSVNLAVTTAQNTLGAGTDQISGFEFLIGSSFNDILMGTAGANWLYGGAGDDILRGGAASDTIEGGSNGAIGDAANYISSAKAVKVDLNLQGGALAQAHFFSGTTLNGDAADDYLSGIENVFASAFGDQITGDLDDNLIEGMSGADTLVGGSNATIGDTLSYGHSTAAVNVNLLTGAVSGGHAAGDQISGFENVLGSGLGDKLTGDSGANILTGGAGADTLSGGIGADTYYYRSLSEKGDHVVGWDSFDQIVIRAAGFQGTGPHNLVSGQFLVDGSTFIAASGAGIPHAATSAATFLYDTDTGSLYFDSDGAGSLGGAIKLLTIDGAAAIGAAALRIV